MWLWTPGIRVGPFEFGADARDVIHRFQLRERQRDCEGADWRTFELPGWTSWVYVWDDGRLDGVACSDHLIYKDIDLIGATIDDVLSLLGKPDEFEPSEGWGASFTYWSLGLVAWVEQGRVETLRCSEPEDDE